MPRRQSQPHTFEDNIAAGKAKLEAQLVKAKSAPEREIIKRKIKQLDDAARMSDWLRSPSLNKPE